MACRHLLLLLPLAACSGSERGWEIGSTTYVVPPRHVVSAVRSPDLFLRLSHPDTSFHLVYDARVPPGGGIFSITHNALRGEPMRVRGRDDVLCRRTNWRSYCGFAMRHGDSHWSVIFPPSQIDRIDLIRRQAAAQLDSYARR